MFSGFLQAAAYTNLDGVHGHSGWRWLFIIDGIITLPLAVAGYFFFPNLPQGGVRTWWTTEREHVLSVQRMAAVGRAGKQPWTKKKVGSLLRSWHTWVLRTSSSLFAFFSFSFFSFLFIFFLFSQFSLLFPSFLSSSFFLLSLPSFLFLSHFLYIPPTFFSFLLPPLFFLCINP
jgi:MFS family permease